MPEITQLIKSKSLHSQSSIPANIHPSNKGKIGLSFFNLVSGHFRSWALNALGGRPSAAYVSVSE